MSVAYASQGSEKGLSQVSHLPKARVSDPHPISRGSETLDLGRIRKEAYNFADFIWKMDSMPQFAFIDFLTLS